MKAKVSPTVLLQNLEREHLAAHIVAHTMEEMYIFCRLKWTENKLLLLQCTCMQLVCGAHAHTHVLSGGRRQKDSYSNYIPGERRTGGGIVAVLD